MTELELLRRVYEAARSVLRYNGIDNKRTIEALNKLDDAIESVKLFDAGLSNLDEETP